MARDPGMTARRLTFDRMAASVRWRARRVKRSIADSALVHQRWLYLAREAWRGPSTGRYLMRGSDVQVILRHHTDDTGVFAEIFRGNFYHVPEATAVDLRSGATPPRIIDLGANIGLFGAWTLTHFPGSTMVAVEPDATTLRQLRQMVAMNGLSDTWTILPACASNRAGVTAFAAKGSSVSRMTEPGSADANSEVPVIDVFQHLQCVDVIKMDIEGGEWRIVLDPRWHDISARVVLMEYHPEGCPGEDAGVLARDVLQRAGFVVKTITHDQQGCGMLSAVRG